jgi:pimeloyl-ACP methyl ester carboxylesterase
MAYDMTGEGVPLVFIHQVATDRRLWYQQQASLAPRYRLITVDILGHGELLWPTAELSIESAADHIQWLLEQLGAGAAFLIGVSMGAAVAMRFALNTPSLVRGLVLLSPWARVSGHTQRLIERLFRLAEAGEMASHADLFLRYVLPTAYFKRRIADVERLRAMAMEQDAKAVAYTWAACLSASVVDELGAIRAPTLVIAGLNDLFTPPYLAREVAKELLAVELEVWSETAHFPFLEDPTRFNRRLETFIQRCFSQAMQE